MQYSSVYHFLGVFCTVVDLFFFLLFCCCCGQLRFGFFSSSRASGFMIWIFGLFRFCCCFCHCQFLFIVLVSCVSFLFGVGRGGLVMLYFLYCLKKWMKSSLMFLLQLLMLWAKQSPVRHVNTVAQIWHGTKRRRSSLFVPSEQECLSPPPPPKKKKEKKRKRI